MISIEGIFDWWGKLPGQVQTCVLSRAAAIRLRSVV